MTVSDAYFDVIIEISANAPAVKYELDKETGRLNVDRILKTAMHYPCNYGFITNTLSEDGDPCDALVIASFPIIPGASVKCRAIGALLMEDEGGKDEKIICLPMEKIDPFYEQINDIADLDRATMDRIKHFFEHYKDIDIDKWVRVDSWQTKNHAYSLIANAANNAKNKRS